MSVAGLIFSNIHDGSLPELTHRRTMASVPFGCRYRLIDFALSNMVNSNITNVGIITHYNYQSLLDHIGTGTDWDLARRSGGIKILPPFITAYDSGAGAKVYSTRLEALMGVTNFLSRAPEDYIVLSDCDVICNMDISDMIKFHEKRGADVTIATKHVKVAEHKLTRDVRVVEIAGDDVKSIETYVPHNDVTEADVCMNVLVMKRTLLYNLVVDAAAKGYADFYRDIIAKHLDFFKICAYRYEGYYSLIGSLAGYFECNMKLLDSEARRGLFAVDNRPIYTKVRNSAPAKYCENSSVKGSLVADGCIIEGTVENSIIFRGVKVGKGTVVKNCILLQDTYVGDNVKLNCVISDKNVVIKDYRNLSGHPSMPFYIDKGLTI
jgi:glucose-1-phosphate adenylyltransferase